MSIEQDMAQHVDARHRSAQEKIQAARQAVKEAVTAAVEVGELLTKVKSHHGSGLHTWACENTTINGEQSRAYMSVHYVDGKRAASEDKRCLQNLGILKKAPPRQYKPRTITTPATVASKASATILKSLQSRPVSDMTPGEREVLKMNLEGVAKVFLEASKP